MFRRSVPDCRWRDGHETWQCSISPSTASCGPATLVRLQVHHICVGGQVRDRTTVIQRKTGQPVQFEISEPTRASAPLHATVCAVVQAWVASAGLDSSAYGTHSMRRMKAAQIYKKTGNLRAVSAFARTHEARKHCPLPQHRGRGRAQHLRAGRTLTYIGALPWRGRDNRKPAIC